MSIQEIKTKPFNDQKPGTSGLRKRTKHFSQPNYVENFIQAILDGIPSPGSKDSTLIVGGDGRHFNSEVISKIIKLSAGNQVKHLIIGQNGILSTPAASNLIRKRQAHGGILLTASHNPGGISGDFGIKFNVANGGPAPENVTNRIYELTKTIDHFKISNVPEVDLSKIGTQTINNMTIEIVDSVFDYLNLLKSIFNFDLIKSYLHSTPSPLKVLFDGMHGVTGPYAKSIFVETLGLSADSIQNCTPSPDFGGGHPDPNLTYAHDLVSRVDKENIGFGAASDGDGDRAMIYGKKAFVTPSDSVAIIADWAQDAIPYFKSGIKGLARSMPTSGAIDLVAKAKGLEVFEVPTGWKFFGNLMDAGRLSICGEESFGTGSDHIREKDGLWAVVAWLSILATAHQRGIKDGIKGVLLDHYHKYGRSFFSRYDYEEVESEGASNMMNHIEKSISEPNFIHSTLNSESQIEDGSTIVGFKVKEAGNFSYTDPIDGSVSLKQGLYIKFEDGSRIVYRLSGTGSSGATIRIYVEKYSKRSEEFERETEDGLKPLIEVALKVSKLKEFTGRDRATVIT